MPMTLFRSGRFGVISRSKTTSPEVRVRDVRQNDVRRRRRREDEKAFLIVGKAEFFAGAHHAMRFDAADFPTLMVKGFLAGFGGEGGAGQDERHLIAGLKLWAPQTICRSMRPSLTRQTESLSALGWGSRERTWATTTPSNSPGERDDVFDLESEHGEPFGEFIGGTVEIDVLTEPVEGDLHARQNWRRNRASFS
jgi:hypothetical protein